jgi:hypothetical protein
LEETSKRLLILAVDPDLDPRPPGILSSPGDAKTGVWQGFSRGVSPISFRYTYEE